MVARMFVVGKPHAGGKRCRIFSVPVRLHCWLMKELEMPCLKKTTLIIGLQPHAYVGLRVRSWVVAGARACICGGFKIAEPTTCLH